MKALIADLFSPDGIAELKASGFEVQYDHNLNGDSLKAAVKSFNPDALVVRSTKVNKDIIDNAANLKLIIRAGAGYDTIDFKYAGSRGIAVANCPGKNSQAVAELTIGLIVSIDRMIPTGVQLLREGKWAKGQFANCRGLKGRTLGLVGFGNISALVCKFAVAMGLEVIALDKHQKPEMQQLVGFTYVDTLEKLLKEADIVSLHVPSNPGTKGMVNKDFLGKMKKDAVLINTSRGNLVNDADLLAHLNANKGFWFGADVLNGEPSGKKADFVNAIAQHPQAYVTHHCGASTKQAEAAIGVEAVRVLKKFQKAQEVDNQVNKDSFARPASQKTGASLDNTGLKSEGLFKRMSKLLETDGERFVKDIGAVYHFDILATKGATPVSFTVDLKNGKGSFANGKVGKADTAFTFFDEDILKFADGSLNPQMAFV